MHELAELFLTRLDDELEQEKLARRAGRPMSKRQEELEAAKARDQHEYDREGLRACCIPIAYATVDPLRTVMPDLSDKTSVISLRYWLDTLEGATGYQT